MKTKDIVKIARELGIRVSYRVIPSKAVQGESKIKITRVAGKKVKARQGVASIRAEAAARGFSLPAPTGRKRVGGKRIEKPKNAPIPPKAKGATLPPAPPSPTRWRPERSNPNDPKLTKSEERARQRFNRAMRKKEKETGKTQPRMSRASLRRSKAQGKSPKSIIENNFLAFKGIAYPQAIASWLERNSQDSRGSRSAEVFWPESYARLKALVGVSRKGMAYYRNKHRALSDSTFYKAVQTMYKMPKTGKGGFEAEYADAELAAWIEKGVVPID